MKESKYFFCMLLVLISGCSLFSINDSAPKSKQLNMNFKHADWVSTQADLSDRAFRNSKTNSFIIVNSYCKKYISNSLKSLTNNILGGIQKVQIQSQVSSNLLERESLTTDATGIVDGLSTYIRIITLKKNRCIYDFLLISTSLKKRTLDSATLDQLIRSSHIE